MNPDRWLIVSYDPTTDAEVVCASFATQGERDEALATEEWPANAEPAFLSDPGE